MTVVQARGEQKALLAKGLDGLHDPQCRPVEDGRKPEPVETRVVSGQPLQEFAVHEVVPCLNDGVKREGPGEVPLRIKALVRLYLHEDGAGRHKVDGHRPQTDCVERAARSGDLGQDRTMRLALTTVRSLRAVAVMAALTGFPAAASLLRNVMNPGQRREACRAAM